MRSESAGELLQFIDITSQQSLNDVLGTDAISTQTVQNGLIKATHTSHIRIDMEGIGITSQSVEDSLIILSLLFKGFGGLRFGGLGKGEDNLSFVAKASDTSDKDTHVLSEDGGLLSIIFNFFSGDFEGDESSGFLISNIDTLSA